MDKLSKKLQKELESMSNVEYFQYLQVMESFKFIRRMINERMEYDSDEKFLDQVLYSIMNNYFINPFYQCTFSLYMALNEKPEDRWMHTSHNDRKMYYEWKKIDALNYKKSAKPRLKFYKKHFHDELVAIRKYKPKPDIGHLWWKKTWSSICNKHMLNYNEDCEICQYGYYTNVWESIFNAWLCKLFYPLWYWWVNRK
jgi:hypothetical protein